MARGMKIEVKRGNALNLPLTALRDGQPLDLNGHALVYLVKENWSDPDADAVLSFTTTLTDGLQIVTTSPGLLQGGFNLTATPAKMRLPRSRYYGGLQATPSGGTPIEFPSNGNPDEWRIFNDAVHATA